MIRKRKKIIKYRRKSLPKIYSCPKCGTNSITLNKISKQNIVKIYCTNCELKTNMNVKPSAANIDIYCNFVDLFFQNK